METKKMLGAVAVAMSALLSVTACNPAAKPDPAAPQTSGSPGATAESVFKKELTGALKTSGFNPSDEVGKSRGDLATKNIAPATVTMDTTNFDTQKFAAQVASGQTPDLIQVDRSMVGTLADKKLIMPLDECFKLWEVNPTEYWYEAAVADVTYDGKLYAVPQFFQAAIIIGNKNVMGPAGVSIEQLDSSKPESLVDAAKKMTKLNNGTPTVLGFDADLPGSAATWVTIFGGKVMDDTGKPTLDDPANVKALEWMGQLMEAQGGFAKAKSFKDTHDVFGDENQYVKNQVGAQVWAQWYINVLSNTKSKVSLAATPLKTADGEVVGMAGGTAFAIPTASKNPSAACAWAIHATSEAAWEAAGTARAATVKEKSSINTGLFTGSPSADKLVRDKFVVPSGNADFDQLISTSYAALANTKSVGGSAVGQQIGDALRNAVAQSLAGTDPATALKDAQATAMRAWDQSEIGKAGG